MKCEIFGSSNKKSNDQIIVSAPWREKNRYSANALLKTDLQDFGNFYLPRKKQLKQRNYFCCE